MIPYILSFFLISSRSFLLFAEMPDRECVEWFKESKIHTGTKNCELRCSSLITDMETFICPDQCNLLCNSTYNSSLAEKFLYYPGLTPEEQKLVAKYPKDAINVFIQKTRAESSTNRIFPDQKLNDESDAFRHYVWAGLLTKELGKAKAKEFLDAHESNRLQTTAEKEMDLFNNAKGQQAAEKLISQKKWNLESLETNALKDLNERALKVLKPGLTIPEAAK